ncbi:MAG: tRNA lysidine(34) synthetase TilS [Alphaproteobacteria bacterium]
MATHEFRAALDSLLRNLGRQGEGPLALGVSGGSDSMALLRLVHEAYPGRRIAALTVDHELREGSAHEAAQVGEWCRTLGVSHRVLRWEGEKPTTGLQRRARAARYALLAQAAAQLGDNGIAAPLLVAHTRDDQAETFLLRLAHGSDIGGLGAMRAASEIAFVPPVPLLRPLLGFARESLRATLKARGQPWIDDPSNDDTRFERIRIRKLMPVLGEAGLPGESLARASALMARIDRLLIDQALAACSCKIAPEGSASFETRAFAALPARAAERLLSYLIRLVGGEAYPPARASLRTLADQLKHPEARGATLGGCRIKRERVLWVIEREARAASRAAVVSLADGGTTLWDNRFWLRLPAGFGAAEITAKGGGPVIVGGEGRVDPPAIAASAEAFREMRAGPVALFVGEARLKGETGRLWAQVVTHSPARM